MLKYAGRSTIRWFRFESWSSNKFMSSKCICCGIGNPITIIIFSISYTCIIIEILVRFVKDLGISQFFHFVQETQWQWDEKIGQVAHFIP